MKALTWTELPIGALALWDLNQEHYVKLDGRLAARVSTRSREGLSWFDGHVAPIVNFDEVPTDLFTVVADGFTGRETSMEFLARLPSESP